MRRYPNSLEKDRDIAAQDPTKPAKAKKSKFAAELLVEGADGAFPNADAWVGIFPEPVRQTQRSVACARVRVSERRILSKTVGLSLLHFSAQRERDASACIRRHQPFARAPVPPS